MAKTNPLAQALNKRAQAAAPSLVKTVPAAAPRQNGPSAARQPASRQGRVMVGGFFAPEVQTALKVIAAEERTTMQKLLTEGINLVLSRRGRPEIAGMQPAESTQDATE